MSRSVVKKCQSCGFEVDPKHTGKCPNCGNVGYHITATVNEVVEISDRLDVAKNRLNEAYDIQLKKLENQLDKIKDDAVKIYLNKIIEIVLTKKQEEVDKLSKKIGEIKKLKAKEPETHKKTFTIDAVLAQAPTEKEVNETVDKNLKSSTAEALEQLGIDVKEIKKITREIHFRVIKLSSKKTLLLGLGIGAGGSAIVWFLTTILLNWINNFPPAVIVNATNSTI